MKRILGMCLTMAVLTMLSVTKVGGAELKVGTFEADITPPLGTVAPYGMGPAFNRVTDPLYAKGIVILPAGQEPIVLCALDWVSLAGSGYDAFREALAKAVGTKVQRVSVHVIHVHGAPCCDFATEELAAAHGCGGLHFNVEAGRAAVAATAEAARQTLAKAVPITHVGVGKGRVEKVASTRRLIGDDGKMKYWRGSGPARDPIMFDLPEGLIDPDVRLIALWNGDQPVAALTYYATHPMSHYGDGELSADFVGIARKMRDEAVRGVRHIYFNGGGGNIAPGKYNTDGLGSRPVLAQRLAAGMAAAWDQAKLNRQPLKAGDVAWRFAPIQLPLKPNLTEESLLKKLDDSKIDKLERVFIAEDLVFVRRNSGAAPIELSRLTLGPAEVVNYPGEPVIEYQLAAQAMRPDRFVCFAGYAEYGPVYISTELGHFQGGFEAERWCRTSALAERVLITATRKLLDAPPVPEPSAQIPAGASPYMRAVLEDRPSAYFRLGESDHAAGLRDSSQPPRAPGAYYGSPKLGEPGAIAGDADTAIRLDGQKTWGLASTTLANITIKASFTAEVWAKSATPAFNSMAWFVSKRGPDGLIFGPDVFTEGGKTMQRLSAWVLDDQGRSDAAIRGPALPDTFDVKRWHHYAVTYDAASDTAVIYLDGQEYATRRNLLTATGGKRSPQTQINLVFGRDDAMAGRFGDGWLDEVAVYAHVLTSERIQAHYRAGRREQP
ncbi:MAG: hypothetical protein PCFJNLEI_00621 [Verrucomicrobiae bacterium]|nr:hypothetical protein [Verrucomicrobiae bacterium]